MKERVSITIDKEVLEKIDSIVDGKKYRSRSHFIDVAIGNQIEGEKK